MANKTKRLVVLVHEIYGITENLRQLRTLLEMNGFKVLLPALYADKYVGTDEKAAYDKFYAELGLEGAKAKIAEIVAEHQGEEITLVGFSVGATVAWLLSENPGLHSAIGVYGTKIRDYLQINPIVRTDLLFCEESHFDVDKMIAKLNDKEKVNALFIDGSHGFYTKDEFGSASIANTNKLILALLLSSG